MCGASGVGCRIGSVDRAGRTDEPAVAARAEKDVPWSPNIEHCIRGPAVALSRLAHAIDNLLAVVGQGCRPPPSLNILRVLHAGCRGASRDRLTHGVQSARGEFHETPFSGS